MGYNWEQIQSAQQGGRLSDPILHHTKPMPNDDDIKKLGQYGVTKLEEMQLFGVLDRLKNGGKL